MKKIYILSIFILTAIFAIADIMSDSGIAGKTGSPGENNCTGCHTSFAVNSGPGSITISSSNLTNWEYIPGQVYLIDVTVAQASMPLFGFGFEALRTSNNSNGGTLGNITGSTETQLKTANVSGNNRTNVVHKKNAGLTANTHTFSFKWTAPATNIGNIMFYAAGNASDNQGDSLNDYIYTTSQLVSPFTTGISANALNESLIVFPNPAHDQIKINVPSNTSFCNFKLYSSEGELVLNENKQHVNSSNSFDIQLPNKIPNGIYFLNALTDSKQNFTTKVLVNN